MDFYELRETCLKPSGKASWQKEGEGAVGDVMGGAHSYEESRNK